MTSEEEKRREEENRRFLKRLLDSEAETRADAPVDGEDDEAVDPNATTKASPAQRTSAAPRIDLDENNMPLPRRVDEYDLEGTRVSPVAYESPSRPRPAQGTQTRVARPVQPPIAGTPTATDWRSGWGGCLIRGFLVALFGIVVLTIIGGSGLLFAYYSIARTLPSVEDLQNRASQFETTRILDRNGNPLYEILDPTAGRRTYVTLDKISPVLIAATIQHADHSPHGAFEQFAVWNSIEGAVVNGRQAFGHVPCIRILPAAHVARIGDGSSQQEHQ